MITIKNYKYYFSKGVYDYSNQLFAKGCVGEIERYGDSHYKCNIKETKTKSYDVNISMGNDGKIFSIECQCPIGSGDTLCRHMEAALIKLEEVYEKEISQESSENVGNLISQYTNRAISTIGDKVSIVPELLFDGLSLFFRLKIGAEKLYVVNNIEDLKRLFDMCGTKRYGKNFEFTHSYGRIDQKSRRLMDLAYDVFLSDRYRYNYSTGRASTEKQFFLCGESLEKFIDICQGDVLTLNNRPFIIKNENAPINIKLGLTKAGRMTVSAKELPLIFGYAQKGYFFYPDKNTIYASDSEYVRAAEPLIIALLNGEIYVSKLETAAFYNSIVRRLEKWITFEDNGLLEDVIPPQLEPKLYIDVNDNGEVIAHMKYKYGEKSYSSRYKKNTNPFCDAAGEQLCEARVNEYFQPDSGDRRNPYIIRSEEDIFNFITTGLPELADSMEVFVSERFNGINVRRSVRPSVGVSVSGGLLEMTFSADGYSMSELAELLKSYRRGSKYHRFKDGSFAIVDDGVRSMDVLTREMNITDKAFADGSVSVPMYRMLYLDSLRHDENAIRIDRSKNFRGAVKEFNAALGDDTISPLDPSLESVLRDYQRTGYQWLSTLGRYHMGGILADDMGLGKTVQAIALMLSLKRDREKAQFLVICPSSLTINWANEIHRFAPSLSVVCLNGTAAERKKYFEELDNYDVVITSYATVLRDIELYESRKFTVQILDEAQNIKNHNTQSAKAVKVINSELRFALTGTPIENTLAELWSIFDFIMPGYLHGYTYFKKNYETPIVKNGDEEAAKSLRRLTSPFILRRIKSDVLTELPDKTETVLYAEFQGEQHKLYAANVAQIRGELEGLNENTDKIKILAMLTRLRQLCCDPSLVYEDYTSGSAKLEQCVELVKSCVEAGHKILLFSQFTTMLDIISARFSEENISTYMLTGKTKPRERIRLVNEFNKNDVSVFLISLKAGGTGLNLTGADIVIHYDPWWNLSAENQASDRVYRIGQKKNVQIYKLITKDTIEEKIRDLQQRKADLLDTALSDTGESNIMNMTADEVMSLL